MLRPAATDFCSQRPAEPELQVAEALCTAGPPSSAPGQTQSGFVAAFSLAPTHAHLHPQIMLGPFACTVMAGVRGLVLSLASVMIAAGRRVAFATCNRLPSPYGGARSLRITRLSGPVAGA